MTGMIGVPAFLLLLSSVISAASLTTVLVYDDDSDNSTIQTCLDILRSGDVAVHPYRINVARSLESIHSDVCTRIAQADDLALILDYSRVQAVNSLLDGVSQQLHVPHLKMGSAFQSELGGHDFQLQVYPGAMQRLLLQDFLGKERMEERWMQAIVILPAKTSDLQNFATLMLKVKQPLVLRKWTNVMEENIQTVDEFAKSSVKNFIVGLAPGQLEEFFQLMSLKKLLTFSHRFLLTHPEASGAKLSTFAYSGAHIVAFRPVLGAGNAPMIAKLTGIAKNLAAPLKTLPPSNWRPRCSGEAWTGGRRAMAAILDKAAASHGVLRRGADLTCPAVAFQFSVDELTTAGYSEMLTWRSNESFRAVENPVRRKRQIQRRKLRVTTIVDAPYVMYDKDKKKYSGLVIDILDEIAKTTKFEYEIDEVKDGQYGRKVGPNKWNGMIGAVMNGEADMAAAALTITYERAKVVDFTTPFMSVGLVLLSRKPGVDNPGPMAFFAPFTIQVWILTIVAFFITSLALFVAARLSPDEWHHSNPTTKVNQFTLAKCFWFVTGAMLFRGTNLCPRAVGTRLVSLAWWFFVLLMVIAYAVSVQNYLTVERMTSPIRNVEDLAEQTNVKYGTVGSGSSYSFFENAKDPTYKKMFEFMKSNRDTFVKSTKEGMERVMQGNFVFIMDSALARYLEARNCSLKVLKGRLDNTKGYGFAFPRGSQFRDIVSESLLLLQKKQVLIKLLDKWIYKPTQSCREYDDERSVTRAFDHLLLSGLFVGLVIGLIIALVICILEIIIRACCPKYRGERTFVGYLGHRLKLLFCTFNGKDVHEKTDAGTELS